MYTVEYMDGDEGEVETNDFLEIELALNFATTRYRWALVDEHNKRIAEGNEAHTHWIHRPENITSW